MGKLQTLAVFVFLSTPRRVNICKALALQALPVQRVSSLMTFSRRDQDCSQSILFRPKGDFLTKNFLESRSLQFYQVLLSNNTVNVFSVQYQQVERELRIHGVILLNSKKKVKLRTEYDTDVLKTKVSFSNFSILILMNLFHGRIDYVYFVSYYLMIFTLMSSVLA